MKKWTFLLLALAIIGCSSLTPAPGPGPTASRVTPKWKCVDHTCIQDNDLGTYLSISDCSKACSGVPTLPPNPGPPVPPPPVLPLLPGSWSDAVTGAIPIVTRDSYGWSVYGITIPKGGMVYIVFDPKAVGAQMPTIFKVTAEDTKHKNTASVYCDVLELDAANNLIRQWQAPQGGQDDWPFTIKKFTPDKYQAGEKFLIRLAEGGYGSTSINVKIK